MKLFYEISYFRSFSAQNLPLFGLDIPLDFYWKKEIDKTNEQDSQTRGTVLRWPYLQDQDGCMAILANLSAHPIYNSRNAYPRSGCKFKFEHVASGADPYFSNFSVNKTIEDRVRNKTHNKWENFLGFKLSRWLDNNVVMTLRVSIVLLIRCALFRYFVNIPVHFCRVDLRKKKWTGT